MNSQVSTLRSTYGRSQGENSQLKQRLKVFVSRCYDLIHLGHVEFFRQAAQYGDLYVGIGADKTYQGYKHHKIIFVHGREHPLCEGCLYQCRQWGDGLCAHADHGQTLTCLWSTAMVAVRRNVVAARSGALSTLSCRATPTRDSLPAVAPTSRRPRVIYPPAWIWSTCGLPGPMCASLHPVGPSPSRGNPPLRYVSVAISPLAPAI